MEIIIRRTEPSDARAIKEIYECENAYKGTLQLPLPSQDMWDKRLSNMPDHVYSYVALLDNEIVGNLGFEVCTNPRRRHVGSLGMGVKDNVQGKGVGSALLAKVTDLADNWLNLTRLELTVYVDNERAISLYKKFGFQIEGESIAFAFRQGEYVNVYHMARIAKAVREK
ncbi:GNAT family N-acetyltransferase [Vibrio azureus]|uniref:Putative N-acetyltransferase n=1 Tax=Vibrio azureus NBRC 104587 TaxID=1219077 RepID=U3A3X1_9VIBR|nr:GNAT family N-acetyltransferase [Vibrio azureus]AUI86041.1 GNAT family N-acetyltransferase [Vibrio azureus]GAD74706.1 putative N-acetyltransferase [Vibrio azureus NBRC 104587]